MDFIIETNEDVNLDRFHPNIEGGILPWKAYVDIISEASENFRDRHWMHLSNRLRELPGVVVEANEMENGISWKYVPVDHDGNFNPLSVNKRAGSLKGEFGFARNPSPYRTNTIFDIGGHCVVPPSIVQDLIDSGWVFQHPFAGKYHGVLRVHIPETLVYYRIPRNEEELINLWNFVIFPSYQWISYVG